MGVAEKGDDEDNASSKQTESSEKIGKERNKKRRDDSIDETQSGRGEKKKMKRRKDSIDSIQSEGSERKGKKKKRTDSVDSGSSNPDQLKEVVNNHERVVKSAKKKKNSNKI